MIRSQSQILQRILGTSHLGPKALAVFDLDSTLFDVSPRLRQIVLDFSTLPEIRELYPRASAKLQTIEFSKLDWGVRRSVERLGLTQEPPDFYERLKAFWLSSFFSNEYMQYDLPFAGSVEFVNRLFDSGVRICYLTGRDRVRMETGTINSLRTSGFPIDQALVELAMKPNRDVDDGAFKKQWFVQYHGGYEKVWFFENEPVNVRLVQESTPSVEIVFFDSTHSSRERAHPKWPRIQDFQISSSTDTTEGPT